MRDNEEGMKGRLDSISQVNVRRDAMTPVPMDSANVGPIFWVKELNPFDPGLDLVRSQVLERSEYEK
ncbi:hypothetical protein G5I_14385 [Acromyrmex echinatior]|uniref:Uncharacterized protein n=1 Tax=Acromyrmex echinatior TaxID=103372 RepID=F4X7K5_ACREC|nr:hypothetical protein G5I_14385 [Acromyrmex echinatior]